MAIELDAAGAEAALGSVAAGGDVLRVSPDKVRTAADVVRQHADALQQVITQNGPHLQVQPPAQSQLVVGVANAWNKAMLDGDDSYLNRANEYLQSLRRLHAQLTAAAQRYDEHEHHARELFRRHQSEHG